MNSTPGGMKCVIQNWHKRHDTTIGSLMHSITMELYEERALCIQHKCNEFLNSLADPPDHINFV